MKKVEEHCTSYSTAKVKKLVLTLSKQRSHNVLRFINFSRKNQHENTIYKEQKNRLQVFRDTFTRARHDIIAG